MGSKFRNPWLDDIQPYVPGKPIDEVRRELGLSMIHKLASNEIPFGPPMKVVEALAVMLTEIHRYPDSAVWNLRGRLAEKLGVDRNRLVFGNGSSELISLAARCVGARGRNTVGPNPSFVMYPIVTAGLAMEHRAVPLTGPDFEYDTAAMFDRVDEHTAVLFLCGPNNPTGGIVPRDDLDHLLKEAPADVLVVVDEAYAEFVTETEWRSSLERLNLRENLLVLRTFSKIHGLAGLRIGYGVAPEWLAADIERIREPFNVNVLAQTAALAVLDLDDEISERRRHVATLRDDLGRSLEGLGCRVVPSQANFVWVDIGMDVTTIFRGLLEHGVIIRTGDIFGDPWRTYARITVGSAEENKALIDALRSVGVGEGGHA